MKLVIIIPAFNEEKTIQDVIKSIPLEISDVSSKEILVVDDGSSDQTAILAKQAGAEVFSLSRHSGLGQAFATGIELALQKKADLACVIDADCQFDGQDIPFLIEPILKNGADVVLGSRFMTGGSADGISQTKLWGNKFMARFISFLCKNRFFDVACGFRAYSREALLNINLFGNFTYTQELVLSLYFKNLNIQEKPIIARYFPERKSSVSGNLFSYGLRTLKIIFRAMLDFKPLQFFGGAGIFLAGVGFLIDIFVFGFFLKTGGFSPYKTLGGFGLSFIALGIIIFTIGLVADILDRMRQNQERLLYLQKKKIYYGN